MKNILVIFIVSFCITQIPIEIKEYRFYKDRDIKQINVLDLIQESDGLFKVELIRVDQIKYDRIKKILVLPCELEFSIKSNTSNKSIDYKICKDKIQSENYLMINKKSPDILFEYDKFKYLEG